MTYDHIETFLTVVSCGNISAAANELFVTQSTVSTRIQQLEEELGAQLVIRSRGHRNIELTSYGQAFVPIASQCAEAQGGRGHPNLDHRQHRLGKQLHPCAPLQ